MATILTYHNIGNDPGFSIGNVRSVCFSKHIDLYSSLGLRSVPATVAVGKHEQNLISITFDDGYASVYQNAVPVMVSAGFTGTVFPVVGAIGGSNHWDVNLNFRRLRHLGWAELRQLSSAGFEIGSHTLSHCDLTRVSRKRLRQELRISKLILEDRIGKPVTAIAYPFGKCSQEVVEEAIDAGYVYGFLSYFTNGSDRMRQCRFSVYSIDTESTIRRKLGIGWGQCIEVLKCRLISLLSQGTPLVKRV